LVKLFVIYAIRLLTLKTTKADHRPQWSASWPLSTTVAGRWTMGLWHRL
jgi:hypothetical protein